MSDITDRLHPSDLTELADLVAELTVQKLGGSMVSSAIPSEIAQYLRNEVRGWPYRYRHVIPLGTGGLSVSWIVNPDGSISQELATVNGDIFWRGQFVPADAEATK